MATQNAVANAEKDRNYRDLSGLTPERLNWIKQNHMQPVPPGIPWNHPRVEFTENGLPIIWVSDNCVIIPPMLLLLFCQIGHIEANGELFEQMRDPHEP